jgi:hypothetical protein
VLLFFTNPLDKTFERISDRPSTVPPPSGQHACLLLPLCLVLWLPPSPSGDHFARHVQHPASIFLPTPFRCFAPDLLVVTQHLFSGGRGFRVNPLIRFGKVVCLSTIQFPHQAEQLALSISERLRVIRHVHRPARADAGAVW